MTNDRLGEVLAGLDDEQRAAVAAPPGPVCILAGAGTGKTRAVTHRIAYRVLRGDVRPTHVLAVTFTARAAGELRDRLRPMGVDGVQARTFHSAALRQLRYFAPRLLRGRDLPELLDSKAKFVGIAAARVGLQFSRTKLRDVAGEIEWAKSSLVEPDAYQAAALRAGRDIPGDAAEVAKVFTAYEEAKRRAGVIDFEDMLSMTAAGMEEHEDMAAQVRAQYRLFIVDEFQDVNPLQHRLLNAWLGDRDDLTVVGDAAQTIYSFTGATADYLLDFTRTHRESTVVRLVRDYRSTPQIVGLANETIAAAAGAQARLRLTLVGQRPDGPEPQTLTYDDEGAEAAAVAARCAELIARGTPAGQIAVLFRTNAQSETYEAALADAGVPTVVQGAARFFDRPEVRQAVVALRAATRAAQEDRSLPEIVVEALEAVGWRPQGAPGGGQAREKWEAVAALVRLAEEHAHLDLPGFVAELGRRAAVQHVPTVDGVTLASFHAAKGLEWDAVFLVGLVDGTLPTTYARTSAQLEEERRLLYVGITRARERLWLSWSLSRLPGGRPRRPCRFLAAKLAGDRPELAAPPPARKRGKAPRGPIVCRVCAKTLIDAAERKLGRCLDCPSDVDEELYERLVAWRLRVATAASLPAYTVFTNATLTAIAELRPAELPALAKIGGVGPRKLMQYGEAVLALVGGASPDEIATEHTSSATEP